MEQTTEPLVVGVRFGKVGKVYHFVADAIGEIKVGDMVVVETSRGWQLGQVAQIVPDAEPPTEGWKPIDRRATPRDLLLRQMWQMKEAEVISTCRAKSVELNLVGIKIVSAEYSFDGSRLTILFSSETEEKYDLKSMRSDMQKLYAPSQVEMRQIGPRDVAKTVCGMGACGLETRCCCLFLTEFSSISIRMAKEQGISLTPTEITGMCGRLRCCLIYEYDNYVEARAKLPKRNKRVRTPQGEGKVVDVVPLRGSVIVELPETGRREFSSEEVQLIDETGAVQQPKPFEGTKQPSVMDQDITGAKDETSFVITPEESPTDTGWDAPTRAPDETAERSERPERGMPGRGERPGPRGERGGQGFRRQPGRDQSGGRDVAGERDVAGGREGGPTQGKEQQPGRGQQPSGKGPRGQRPGESPSPRERPSGEQRPGGQQRPDRGPRREGRPGPPVNRVGKPDGEQQPGADRPRKQGGGGAPKGRRDQNRDQRRKKGPRRDTSDNENGA